MGSSFGVEKGITRRRVHRVDEDTWIPEVEDEVVVEEPLQIRLAGETFMTTMRTPGDDESLVLGLLWAEGLITGLDDISAIAPCGEPGDQVVDVRPGPGVVFELDHQRRGTLTSASCGVCGRAQIDDLLERIEPVVGGKISLDAVRLAVASLEQEQPRFERTGALHAAAILDRSGELLATAEDVGRHNAVDKVVGMMLREGETGAMLTVSGRTSFEIVQKAACARLPVVVSVSGPTSLAIDLAEQAGITLVGFARGRRMNVYTHPQRLRS